MLSREGDNRASPSDTFLVLTANAQSTAKARPSARPYRDAEPSYCQDRGSESIVARSMVTAPSKWPYLKSRSSCGRKTNDVLIQRVGGGYQLYTPARWDNFKLKESATGTPPERVRNKGTQTDETDDTGALRSPGLVLADNDYDRPCCEDVTVPAALPKGAVQAVLQDIKTASPPCRFAGEPARNSSSPASRRSTEPLETAGGRLKQRLIECPKSLEACGSCGRQNRSTISPRACSRC
ncbi:hypothetical protein CSUI_004064, partial [Cystoisospora suis]